MLPFLKSTKALSLLRRGLERAHVPTCSFAPETCASGPGSLSPDKTRH